MNTFVKRMNAAMAIIQGVFFASYTTDRCGDGGSPKGRQHMESLPCKAWESASPLAFGRLQGRGRREKAPWWEKRHTVIRGPWRG